MSVSIATMNILIFVKAKVSLSEYHFKIKYAAFYAVLVWTITVRNRFPVVKKYRAEFGKERMLWLRETFRSWAGRQFGRIGMIPLSDPKGNWIGYC